jgi:PS-10 peptidase S37
MTSLWRLCVATALLLSGLGTVAVAEPASAAEDDILARLRAVPGLTVVAEQPAPAPFRFFVLKYRQYADHRRPSAGTFEQRLTLLHRGADRPTVLHTTGYEVPQRVFRSEPAQLIDGNQISVEQRYFAISRPQPADWSKLNVWQAATDHHRLVTALKRIYAAKWISTGASKGGMTSVYHRRFYPSDVDGTIAYVAPNDVINVEDSAYDRFFARVGTAGCRKAMENLQVEALRRRAEMVPKYAAWAAANKQTFEELVGDVDRAFEYLVSDAPWAFWQYSDAADCADVPATTASTDAILTWLDTVNGFAGYTDEGNQGYVPYYYQAGTQLGSPEVRYPHLKGLLRYPGLNGPRTYVPRTIPMRFQPLAMIDVDLWVKLHGRRLMFVYGQNDPWGAEPFRLGLGTRDSFSYQAAGANHGANVSLLTAAERAQATAAVRRWAGVSAPTGARQVVPLRIPALDGWNPALERRPF